MFGYSNTTKFKRHWLSSGGEIRQVRRSGHLRFTHPGLDRSILMHGTRESVPRALRVALRKVSRDERSDRTER